MTNRSQVQLEWGTAAELAAFAGVAREPVWDITNNRLVVMTGGGAGLFTPLASEAYVQTQIASISAGLASTLFLFDSCV